MPGSEDSTGEAGGTPAAPRAHVMQCMEVWGGNEAADNAVTMPGLQTWVLSRPYRGEASGGDIHYLSSCMTGRITRLLVADVSGHGASVSDVANTLRRLMRKYVNYIDQRRFVTDMSREFGELAQAGRFATAVAATYWGPTGEFVACNAGHPRPLWYRSAAKEWSVLGEAGRARRTARADQSGPSNLPLGLDAGEPPRYDELRVRLAPDDLVLLYTDSVTESRDAGGRLLGERGLLDLVRTLDPSRPAELIPGIVAALAGRSGADAGAISGASDDDLTLLLLRRTRDGPRMTMHDKLVGLAQYGRKAVDAIRGGSDHPFPWPELTLRNIGGAFIRAFNGRAER